MKLNHKNRLRWGIGVWVLLWISGFFQMGPPLWKILWALLGVINLGAYWFVSGENIDTERGLQKVSQVLIGFIYVQIAVAVFLAIEATGKR